MVERSQFAHGVRGRVERLHAHHVQRRAGNFPFDEARVSAASSTMAPRETLIKTALDFIAAISRSPIKWRVSPLSTQ